MLGICVIGVALTALASWATARVDEKTEERLLEVQAQQAASVLSTAVLLVQQPLETALGVQTAVGSVGSVTAFESSLSSTVGPDGQFISASLWLRRDGTSRLLASVGPPADLGADASAFDPFLDLALTTPTTVVRKVDVDQRSRIVYGLGDPASHLVVYAERAIAEDRRAESDGDAAFADINYAIYLGPATDLADLTTTNVDPSSLPFAEPRAETTIPFGDTVLTLQVTPANHLGSTFSQQLPYIVLIGGLLLTGLAALVAQRLVFGRREAETQTRTIAELYDSLDVLYGEQRRISERLQRALLPQTNPEIPMFEIAAEYVAGADDVNVGGDWFSVVAVNEDQFGFVVGDVSGHGLDAVAVMARARFTIRAYLADGHDPQTVLEKAATQFDISDDGHMTTVLVGLGNWRTGELTMASAGHLPPLLLTDQAASFVPMTPGPPLGVGTVHHHATKVALPIGATLVLYTDGLIERRGEPIDAGMERLAQVADPLAHTSPADLVSRLVGQLRRPDDIDDVAVLALRRVSP